MKEGNDKLVDGISFLKEDLQTLQTPIFLRSKLARIIGGRVRGIIMYVRGSFRFCELVNSFLPSRLRKNNVGEKIIGGVREYSDFLFSESGIYDAGMINLFGKRFFPAVEKTKLESWLHTFIMIFQSIIVDQYHARKFIKNDSVIIDAGANAGVFSVFAAHLSPQGKIYSFEPSPETYELLSKNTREYSQILTFNHGLGDISKEENLILAESSGSNTMVDSGMRDGTSASMVKVCVKTIDEVVREQGITRVDFIKMDTEGYEEKILYGAKETIQKYAPVLSMSAYHHVGDKKSIPNYVLSLNPRYKYKISRDVEDNLLFWV
jgi:FkbM family methyltransferase